MKILNVPFSWSAVRGSVKRNSPFGGPDWTAEIVQRLGLQSTLNPRGRPSKKGKSWMSPFLGPKKGKSWMSPFLGRRKENLGCPLFLVYRDTLFRLLRKQAKEMVCRHRDRDKRCRIGSLRPVSPVGFPPFRDPRLILSEA
jgi:hypothetical protein